MKIIAFMPTLGRPELVEQSIRMFEMQTYQDRELLVYDTANQMPAMEGDRWRVVPQGELPPSMGITCNCGIRMSGAELIARWDDDDHYLPWHLEACVEGLKLKPWACPSVVWDYWEPEMLLCKTDGTGGHNHDWAYAGAWSFTREAFEAVGGYREDVFREEECEFRDRLFKRYGPPADTVSQRFPMASYVYSRHLSRHIHLGEQTDAERLRRQQGPYPKVASVVPRWPENYLCGFPLNPKVADRRW